jgi:hypothetical protein
MVIGGLLLLRMLSGSCSMLSLWQTIGTLFFWEDVQEKQTITTCRLLYMISQDQGRWMAAFILCLWVSMVDTSYCVLVFFCRLTIPSHMLPQTNHPTTFSVIRSDNDTILNVLVDMVNFIGLFIVSSLFNLVFFTSLYAVFVFSQSC